MVQSTIISKGKSSPANRTATCVDSASYWDNYVIDYLANPQNSNVCSHQYIKLFYNQLVTLALGRLNLTRNSRILKVDLWNEGIETSRDILGNFGNVETFGFDLSKSICHLAKGRLPKAGIVQATCHTLPFASERFDLLLDLSTIDHIPFSKTQQVFKEYSRVLKPGGLLAVAFWQSNLATRYLMRIDSEQLYFDKQKVAAFLRGEGFEIVDSYDTGALLTMVECNFWFGQFLFWRLKTVFENKLYTSAAKIEPCIWNLLGGLHVFYCCRR